MAHISMHSCTVYTDSDLIEEFESESIPMKVSQGYKGQMDYDGVSYFCREYVFASLRLEKAKPPQIRAALQLMLQTYDALAQMNISHGESIEVSYQSSRITIPVRPARHARQHVWFDAMYYALITRATKMFLAIRELPYEMVMVSEDIYSPFYQGHYKFLCALGTPLEKSAYQKAINPMRAIPAEHRLLFELYFPLWEPVIEMDQAAFDQKLSEILVAHRNYWGSPPRSDHDRINDYKGHSNDYLTGIMAYAFEKGLAINTTSDYTPTSLIRGDFLVDVDTELEFNFPSYGAF
jgi:hypothetical protein